VVPLIVLWDVDHTLIGNVSKEIYAAAFTPWPVGRRCILRGPTAAPIA
jgi:hypothetical protein